LGKSKEGKIAKAYRLHTEGTSIKDIAAKLKIKENVARSYIWRMKQPDKYRALLERYRAKKQKQSSTRPQANQTE
jgi:ribosomal protein S6